MAIVTIAGSAGNVPFQIQPSFLENLTLSEKCEILFMSCRNRSEFTLSCGDSITAMLPLFQTEDGGSSPTSPLQFTKADFRVIRIDPQLAQSISVRNHYLHRKAPCSVSAGLLHRGEIIGVALYGTPSNRNLRSGVCGKGEELNVMELTRLWIEDKIPTNAESFLIRHSLRFVGKEIVISYADPSVNHIGIVYQAAGWLYTGLSAKRPEYTVDGLEHFHKQSIFDGIGRPKGGHTLFGDTARGGQVNAIRKKYGDKLVVGQQVRKHRYVTFLGPRKDELLKKLRYPVMPYPKSL